MRELRDNVTVVEDDSDAALDQLLPQAEIITVRTAKLPRERLKKAPRLKLVVKHGVGADSVEGHLTPDTVCNRGVLHPKA